MIFKIFAFLSFAFFSLPAFSDPIPHSMAIVYGGNDHDNPYDQNMFAPSLVKTTTELSSTGWDTWAAFDHDPNSFSADTSSQVHVRPANKQDFLDLLDKAIATLGSGDQLLLMVYTHGDAGGVFLGADGFVSFSDPQILSRLKKLRDIKKVKMAFSVESCYGGAAVAPWSEYGCVVTASPENIVSNGSLLSDHLRNLLESNTDPKAPITPNDLFLDALRESDTPLSLPQISGFSEGFDLSKFAIELEKNGDFFTKQDYMNVDPKCYGPQAKLSTEAQLQALIEPTQQFINTEKVKQLFGPDYEEPKDLLSNLQTKIDSFTLENKKFDALALQEQALQQKCLALDPNKKFNPNFSLDFSSVLPDAPKNWQSFSEIESVLYSVLGNNLKVSDAATASAHPLKITTQMNPCDFAAIGNSTSNANQIVDALVQNGWGDIKDRNAAVATLKQLLSSAYEKSKSDLTDADKTILDQATALGKKISDARTALAAEAVITSGLFDNDLIKLMNQARADLYLKNTANTTNSNCSSFLLNPNSAKK